MPFKRPTLDQLLDYVLADIKTELQGSDPYLRRTVLRGVAQAQAGVAHGLHGHLAWVVKQLLPDTAEAVYLERHASIYGISRKSACYASGPIDFSGDDGVVIPAGSVLQAANGTEYTTAADVTIAGSSATAQVTAKTAGSAGNMPVGSATSLMTSLSGVQSAALVGAGGIVGGLDPETDTSLRQRVLARIRTPPQGGAVVDYIAWAMEINGVTRVWVESLWNGEGTVRVLFVCDEQPETIIPDAAKVTEVQGHIDLQRPVTANLTVVAPPPVPVNFAIALIPNTATAQAAVQTELEDLVRREAEPGGTLLLSHIREAVSIAAGETDHQLTSPSADVTSSAGEISIMGDITWS